jgi:hypothetical protein
MHVVGICTSTVEQALPLAKLGIHCVKIAAAGEARSQSSDCVRNWFTAASYQLRAMSHACTDPSTGAHPHNSSALALQARLQQPQRAVCHNMKSNIYHQTRLRYNSCYRLPEQPQQQQPPLTTAGPTPPAPHRTHVAINTPHTPPLSCQSLLIRVSHRCCLAQSLYPRLPRVLRSP